MDTEEKPNVLVDLYQEVQPSPEHLERIFRSLGAETLAAEEARLRERFLDIASRLVTINQIRGTE